MTFGLVMQISAGRSGFGEALQVIAAQSEGQRVLADTAPENVDLPRRAPDEDLLIPDHPDHEFYGFGLACESWTTGHEDTVVGRKTGAAFFFDRTLDLYPQRVEGRAIYLCGRDGVSWCVRRYRGAAPFAYCWRPGDLDYVHVGMVVNALSRMTNSITGAQDVPIIPITDPHREPGTAPA